MTFPLPSGPIVSPNGAVTIHTVEVDEDLAVGDLLLINFASHGGMDPSSDPPIISDNVSILVRGHSTIAQDMVLFKVATGDEGGSITVTLESAVRSIAHAYRIPAGEWYGSASGIEFNASSGQSSFLNLPPAFPSWGADDNLYMIFVQAGDDAATVSNWPTGYASNGRDNRSGTAENTNMMVASSWRQENSPSENPNFMQLDKNEGYVATTVAIRPFVAGAATVEVPQGQFTITGNLPDSRTGSTVNVPQSELMLTGIAPTLSGATVTVPAVQLFSLTGSAPTLRTGASTNAPLGELTLAAGVPFIDTTLIWPASEELRTDAWAPASNLPLILVKIEHDDLPTPILVVNNKVNVTSNGDIYTAFPFEIILPDNQEGSPPQAKLRISNVSREIGQAVRSISTPATVSIYLVRQESPDTVELAFEDMTLANVTYDALVVEGVLGFENFVKEAYPAYSFNPADFPGLIR